ncbi:unnamed protein product [Chondrus crispus]|uniref:Uncharacterized protein n=1 Tax=Chondrus crispus TaxID=2769 RepID=R7QMQ7_CHOCR|nr:unnamed protein product [Chondrus crispus]CDF39379.1 unnamed protein product [Chondrus crispus]|eukprot:XP_005719290.1 unnamed protein product [Chondrus crispus]
MLSTMRFFPAGEKGSSEGLCLSPTAPWTAPLNCNALPMDLLSILGSSSPFSCIIATAAGPLLGDKESLGARGGVRTCFCGFPLCASSAVAAFLFFLCFTASMCWSTGVFPWTCALQCRHVHTSVAICLRPSSANLFLASTKTR